MAKRIVREARPWWQSRPFGEPVWRARLASPFGEPVWRARLARPFGEPVWRARLASPFGEPVWRARLASPFGEPVWQARLASPFGEPIVVDVIRACFQVAFDVAGLVDTRWLWSVIAIRYRKGLTCIYSMLQGCVFQSVCSSPAKHILVRFASP
jgi:hypothetical protein